MSNLPLVQNQLNQLERMVAAFKNKPSVMPTRALKPGQTATISPTRPMGNQKEQIADYIREYNARKSRFDHLDFMIKYGRIPDTEAAQKEMEELKVQLDPATHGYDQIIDQILPIIKTKCSDFLPILLKHGFLFRGTAKVENKNRLAFRAHSRDYRKPVNSNSEANAKFNLAMEELGLKATRENSVFCTSNEVMTGMFGTTYVFFPCNGSHYTWSETIGDLVITPGELYDYAGDDTIRDQLQHKAQELLDKSDKLFNEATDNKVKIFYRNIAFDLDPVNMFDDMKNYEKHVYNLDRILEYGREVEASTEFMDEVEYLISDISKLGNEIEECSFELDMQKFQNYYQLRGDDELETAIIADREILFNGEYICVFGSLADKLKEALVMDTKKDITEALKPGQMKVPPQFKKLDTGSEFEQLERQLAELNSDLKHFKKLMKQYQNKVTASEKNIAKVKTKLANPKLKKQTSDAEFNNLVSFIMKTSGNYIKEMKKANTFLYRGMDEEDGNIIHGRSWLDREPKDSDIDEQEAFDKVLEHLKIKARRANSIFTTGASSFASNYGDLYLIFPYNSAAFSWSSRIKDVVLEPGDITTDIIARDPKVLESLNQKWGSQRKNLEKLSYKVNDDLAADIDLLELVANLKDIFNDNSDEEAEDMISDMIYELRRFKKNKILGPTITNLINILETVWKLPKGVSKASIAKFQKRYAMSDKNFAAALKSKGEILISGEYIAINAEHYGKKLSQALGINFKMSYK